jgi:hypothetical protein
MELDLGWKWKTVEWLRTLPEMEKEKKIKKEEGDRGEREKKKTREQKPNIRGLIYTLNCNKNDVAASPFFNRIPPVSFTLEVSRTLKK